MDGAELPQWISYLGGVAGIIIATVIVRLGWISKGGAAAANKPDEGRLIGALVDAGSVRELTLAIEAHTEIVRATHDGTEALSRELRNLGDEVRRLANKVEE